MSYHTDRDTNTPEDAAAFERAHGDVEGLRGAGRRSANEFPPHLHEAVVIDNFHSRCGACGRGADPMEPTHATVVGSERTAGCGVRWTKITSSYFGTREQEVAQRLRPDLQWIDLRPEAT